MTLGPSVGTNTVTATATGIADSTMTFSATATSVVATQLAFTTQPSITGTAGTALATQPVVKIQDSSGNTVVSATDTITLAAYTDSDCSVAGLGTISYTAGTAVASAGIATFAALKYTKAETIYFKATSGSLTAACTAAGTVISAGAAATIAKTSGDAQTATAGAAAANPMVATITDANGNVCGDVPRLVEVRS